MFQNIVKQKYVYKYMYVYIYICIYLERERDYIYIYIYIYDAPRLACFWSPSAQCCRSAKKAIIIIMIYVYIYIYRPFQHSEPGDLETCTEARHALGRGDQNPKPFGFHGDWFKPNLKPFRVSDKGLKPNLKSFEF